MNKPIITKREVGMRFERHAENFLNKEGFVTLCRNFCIQGAEIDLIMHHQEQRLLIFVEVRARRTNTFYSAIESIDERKCKRIATAADAFLAKYLDLDFKNHQLRFDVITFEAGKINWYPNAFDLNE